MNMSEVQPAFKALGDPTRRQILMQLSRQEMSIGEIASEYPMTRAAVKKHLKVLEEGDLISVEVRGRERINRLQPRGLKVVTDWMKYFDHFWDNKLDALKSIVENTEKQ